MVGSSSGEKKEKKNGIERIRRVNKIGGLLIF